MYTDFIILSAWSVPNSYTFSTNTNLTSVPNTDDLILLTETTGVTGNSPLLYVVLSNTSILDTNDQFTWDFGDAYNNTPLTATSLDVAYHSYIMPGSYSVTLTHTQTLTSLGITPDKIITTEITESITKPVATLNEISPVAAISANKITGTVPVAIQFTPAHTTPGSFAIDKIAWNFGDGSKIQTYNYNNDKTNPVTHTPTHTYTVASLESLTVTMSAFSSSTNTCNVTSYDVGPLMLPSLTGTSLNILKVRNTPHGAIYAVDINNTLAFIKSN